MPHKNISKRNKQKPERHIARETATPETTDTRTEHADSNDSHADGKNALAQAPRFWNNPNHWIAVFTVFIAIANAFYAWFAWRQIEGAHLDQRAWVGVTEIANLHFEAGTKGSATAVIVNSGKTPALKFTGKVTSKVLPKGAIFVPDYTGALTEPSVSVLQPQARTSFDSVSINAFTQDEMSSLRAGTSVLYFFGEFFYEDIFKQPHHTTFCLSLRQSLTVFANCSQYNDAN